MSDSNLLEGKAQCRYGKSVAHLLVISLSSPFWLLSLYCNSGISPLEASWDGWEWDNATVKPNRVLIVRVLKANTSMPFTMGNLKCSNRLKKHGKGPQRLLRAQRLFWSQLFVSCDWSFAHLLQFHVGCRVQISPQRGWKHSCWGLGEVLHPR